MDNIIEKLLEIYLTISTKETAIFDLIYSHHGCDSWEDIFRDYDEQYIEDKKQGVEIALEQVNELVKESNQGNQEKIEKIN